LGLDGRNRSQQKKKELTGGRFRKNNGSRSQIPTKQRGGGKGGEGSPTRRRGKKIVI